MARRSDRHPAGAPGDWFVDRRCIDCGAARHVAPGLIIRNSGDGVSLFTRQPETPDEIEMAWRAVQVCPTKSVGHLTLRRPDHPVFPQDLGDHVLRLGHNSRSSFGAHSYLVERPAGNLMVDDPRWTTEVVEPVEARGGIAHILLSHRDDVADAERYASHFGARVWIHEADADAAPFATDVLGGTQPITLRHDLSAIPVPGHTEGTLMFLVDDRLLFSGDSLAWHPGRSQLHAFREACWFSWEAQTESLARLAAGPVRFDRLFCGHGWSHDLDGAGFHDHLGALLARMPTM